MADDPLIGFQTDSLRFEKLLGKGAMGAVYRGVQLGLDRAVAIKVISPQLADDADYIARFGREARTIGKLVHPNVIACHDFGPSPGPRGEQLYLMVLEFVDGWSLGGLAKGKRLAVRQVLELHSQAAEGLYAAHQLGIVHRDVKPDNIMVTKTGDAKLADFGLARQMENAQLTQAGSIMGSPAFMSPEACRGEEPTPASDIYSLGCSVYQTLTGGAVYPSNSALQVMQEHLNSPIPKLSASRPDLAALQPLLERCLAKDPKSRFPDAHALAKALRHAATQVPKDLMAGRMARAELASAAEPGTSQTEVSRPSLGKRADATHATEPMSPVVRQRRRLVVGVVGAIVACIVVLAVVGKKPPPSPATPTVPTVAVTPADAHPASPTPAVPAPSPKTAPVDAHTAAITATLDNAQRLIRDSDLPKAEATLRDLMVSGELKTRKKALQEELDQAWKAQAAKIAQDLDIQERLITRDTATAIAGLEALRVPDHHPDLIARRDKLLAQAREHKPVTPPVVAVRPSTPDTAPQTVNELPKVTLLRNEDLAPLQRVPAGHPRLPGKLPLGDLLLAFSQPFQERTCLLLRMPASRGGEDGLLLVIHGGTLGEKRTLRVETRPLGGQAAELLQNVTLSGTDWDVVPLRFTDHMQGIREVFLSTVGTVREPFYLAKAAFCANGIPGWNDLGLAAGTLTQMDTLRNGSFFHLIGAIKSRRTDFPQYDQCRIALPDALFKDAHDQIATLLSSLDARFATDPAHPDHEKPSAGRAVIPYSNATAVRYLIDKSGGERGKTNVFFLLLSTAKAPEIKAQEAVDSFKDACEKAPGILPVLVLSSNAYEGPLRAEWQALIAEIRAGLPGLPIIDLAEVPIQLARYGVPITLSSKAGQDALLAGFEAGVAELRSRIDFVINHF